MAFPRIIKQTPKNAGVTKIIAKLFTKSPCLIFPCITLPLPFHLAAWIALGTEALNTFHRENGSSPLSCPELGAAFLLNFQVPQVNYLLAADAPRHISLFRLFLIQTSTANILVLSWAGFYLCSSGFPGLVHQTCASAIKLSKFTAGSWRISTVAAYYAQ